MLYFTLVLNIISLFFLSFSVKGNKITFYINILFLFIWIKIIEIFSKNSSTLIYLWGSNENKGGWTIVVYKWRMISGLNKIYNN